MQNITLQNKKKYNTIQNSTKQYKTKKYTTIQNKTIQ